MNDRDLRELEEINRQISRSFRWVWVGFGLVALGLILQFIALIAASS